jgi:hypothetical protein
VLGLQAHIQLGTYCCLVHLQEVCLQLQQFAANSTLPACHQYACTLASIRGLVFYSTPHQALPRLALPEYEYVLPDMASVCQKFRALCSKHGWRTLGVGAEVQVRGCLQASVLRHMHRANSLLAQALVCRGI